ncbi:Uncharacterized protein conserved in bacteria [Klebsiella pneumoniae]|nr:Uncharacterized protein conserved in bacteria [Klebsiella pneumoniae]
MGRRQHPHVHLDRPATADPLDLLFLEKAQQVGLQLQRQVADLVEEQGAAVGRLDPPDLALVRAGEGALLVAEQLGLDQVLGNRPAVDRDERPVRAPRLPVQGTRDQFLAGAALAPDQYRRVGRCQLRQQPAQVAYGQALAEQLVLALSIAGHRAAPAQAGHAEGAAEGHLHPRHVERQGMEVEEPFADEIADAIQRQGVRAEHGDPLGAAAADQVLHRFRLLQVERPQAQQADVASAFARRFQRAAVHCPTRLAKARQQAPAIVARVHHQQTAEVRCIWHVCSFAAPIL